MYVRVLYVLAFCLCTLLYATPTYASTSSGTINAVSKTARVCKSLDCITPAPGTISFKPTGTTPITIDDTLGIDGIAFGSELGWISLDPLGPEGLVIDPKTGTISGKAWSQNAGWIQFAPSGRGVSITSEGEFMGWAWAGGADGGWVQFDCSVTAACVKTDWRPLSARTAGTAGVGDAVSELLVVHTTGSGSPSDECWNLSGIQTALPTGYKKFGDNVCQATDLVVIPSTTGVGDTCPNIAGIQTTLPRELVVDTGGLCVPSSATSAPLQESAPTFAPPKTTPPQSAATKPPVVDIAPVPRYETQVPVLSTTQPNKPVASMPEYTAPAYSVPVPRREEKPALTAPEEPIKEGVPKQPSARFVFIPESISLPIHLPVFHAGFTRMLDTPVTRSLITNSGASRVDAASLALFITFSAGLVVLCLYACVRTVRIAVGVLR